MHAVDAPSPDAIAVDESHIPEHPEMLGHLRLGERERLDELTHAEFMTPDHFEDGSTVRITNSVEHIGREPKCVEPEDEIDEVGVALTGLEWASEMFAPKAKPCITGPDRLRSNSSRPPATVDLGRRVSTLPNGEKPVREESRTCLRHPG